jgi:hypothetical protein
VEIHLRVACEQAAEDETVEALGLAVGGEARVEIDGIGFNQEGKVGWIEFWGAEAAGEKRKSTERTEEQSTEVTEKTRGEIPRLARNNGGGSENT